MEIKETDIKLSHYAVAIYTSKLEVKIFKDLNSATPTIFDCRCNKIYAELIRVEVDDNWGNYYRRLASTAECFGIGRDFVKTELNHILGRNYGGELIEVPVDNMLSMEYGNQEFRFYSLSKGLYRLKFLHDNIFDEISSGCSLYQTELYRDLDFEILYSHLLTKDFLYAMEEYLRGYSSRVERFKSTVTVNLDNCSDELFVKLLNEGGIYEG